MNGQQQTEDEGKSQVDACAWASGCLPCDVPRRMEEESERILVLIGLREMKIVEPSRYQRGAGGKHNIKCQERGKDSTETRT